MSNKKLFLAVFTLVTFLAIQVPRVEALIVIGSQGTVQQVLGDDSWEEDDHEDQDADDDTTDPDDQEEDKDSDITPVRKQVKERKVKIYQLESELEAKQKEWQEKLEEMRREGKQWQEMGQEMKKEGERMRKELQQALELEEADDATEEGKQLEFEREIYRNGVKIKIEYKDGKLVVKKEYEDGREEYLGEDDVVEIEAKKGMGQRLRLMLEDEDHLVLQGQQVKARLDLPVAVNPETNELVVTTPAGSRVVTVLPDEAVDHILGKAAEVIEQVKLTQYQDEPVYEIEAVDEQKLLGIFKIKLPKKVLVSATSGDVLTTQQSFLHRVLDLFAF